MARYIDADKLIEEYDRVHIGAPGGARKLMVEAPTADVAPKSEVALGVIRKVKNKVRKYKHNVVNPYEHIILYLNELEKKYTEDQNNEN